MRREYERSGGGIPPARRAARPHAVIPGMLMTAWALALFGPEPAAGQDVAPEWLERLERVMPAADRFTDRRGRPPAFEAYKADPSQGGESLIGYAFLTSDLPPEQMGYSGPIEVLVGMDTAGALTGIEVVSYIESLRRTRGDFLAVAEFLDQFVGKSMNDAFQIRRDVDAITGATITVDAMARGIRNAARGVAFAHGLGPWSADSGRLLLDPVTVTLDQIQGLSWSEMHERGLVQQILVLDEGRTATDLKLMYLRDEAVAEALIGPTMLAEVFERAGPAARERQLVVVGADGPISGGLNLARISIVQSGDTVGLAPADVLLFGPPREGKLDGQVRFTRVLLIDQAVDMTRPFTFELDLRPGLGLFRAEYPGVRVDRGVGDAGGAGGGLAMAMVLLILLGTVAIGRQLALRKHYR